MEDTLLGDREKVVGLSLGRYEAWKQKENVYWCFTGHLTPLRWIYLTPLVNHILLLGRLLKLLHREKFTKWERWEKPPQPGVFPNYVHRGLHWYMRGFTCVLHVFMFDTLHIVSWFILFCLFNRRCILNPCSSSSSSFFFVTALYCLCLTPGRQTDSVHPEDTVFAKKMSSTMEVYLTRRQKRTKESHILCRLSHKLMDLWVDAELQLAFQLRHPVCAHDWICAHVMSFVDIHCISAS